MSAPRPILPGGTARAFVTGAPPPLAPAALLDERGADARRDEITDDRIFLAIEIARLATGLSPDEERALAFVVLATLAELARGSTRLPIASVSAALERLGAPGDVRARARALVDEMRGPSERLSPLAGGHGDYRPLVIDDDCIYHQRMRELEVRVAQLLALRLRAPRIASRRAAAERAVAEVVASPPLVRGKKLRLSAEQRRAIEAALEAPMTVISGGPGTGKTSIVVSILRALVRIGDVPVESIALAAPTGRAADRMRRSIEQALRALAQPAFEDLKLLRAVPPARTLHRLLGYSPRSGRYRHHEQNRLAERFVLVDESSMIDLALTDRLLRALRPEAQLVLLGDADQLPSVEAGAVFRDLSEHAGDRAALLTQSHRMDPKDPSGRAVLTIAKRIDQGKADALFTPGRDGIAVVDRARAGEVAFDAVELVRIATSAERDEVWERWWRERVRTADAARLVGRRWHLDDGAFRADDVAALRQLFAHMESARILCITRSDVRPSGVGAVNAWFHDRAQRPTRRRAGAPPSPLAGEPVIVTHNDYDKALFNGDQGVVLEVESAGHRRLAAVFRRDPGFVAFPLEAVRPLIELAYATTVHKAQGSEHVHVAVVLPEDPEHPLLTREILYTAVTRASRSVLFVGSPEALRSGTTSRIDRHTGLASRL